MLGACQLKRLDWPVVVTLFALLAFGWPYMNSASYRSGPEGRGHVTSSPRKQLVWIAAGAVLALALLAIKYRALSELSLLFYLGGLAMLAIVLKYGEVVNGAKSWIVLSKSARFQPSEFVKITTILALAQYLGAERRPWTMGRILGGLAIVGVPVLMIAKQPDLGTALMFVPAAGAMIFVAGARLKHLGMLAAAAIVLMPIVWLGMNDTQKGRVKTWVQQDRKLTQRERVGRFHHLIQSKVAIGSGGWYGKGLGKGTQNKLNYLGFRNTDFVFAVICEEAGFIGANVVILFYLVIAAAGLSIARSCREPVGRLIAVGVVSLLLAQGFVNIAMTVGLLPIVGVTLPFVSYGGSSTLSSFLAVSLLLNVGLRRPRITFAREELGIGPDGGGR